LANTYADMMDRLQDSVLSHVTLMTLVGQTVEEVRERANGLLTALRDNQFQAQICGDDRLGRVLQTVYGHDSVDIRQTISGWTAAVRQHVAALADESARSSHRQRGAATVDQSGMVDHLPTLRDLVEPSAVLESPGSLDLGGMYSTTLVVRAWPETGLNGWLEWLYNFEDPGVRRRVSFYVESLSSAKVMADLRRRQLQLDAETRWARRRGNREDLTIQFGEESIDFLREEIGRGRQRMFVVTLLVTLVCESAEALRRARWHLIQKGASNQLVLRPLYLEESLAFRSTIPVGMQALDGLPTHATRSMPTMALATTFPFSAGEVLDPVGEVWGENRSTGNLVVINPNRYQARHLIVVAKTRSGKSASLKVLASQALMRPQEQVIIIDPSPPIDYERWTRWLQGTYAQFGPGSRDGINPLEILMPARLDRLDDSMRAPIRAKIAFGLELLNLMGQQPLSAEETFGADQCLQEVFAAHGMPASTDGTGESEWATVQDRRGQSLMPRAKPAPTLTEVWQALTERADTQALAQRIRPFVTGLFNMFAGTTTVDMTRPLVVFNVYNLIQGSAGKQHQAVAYAMISEFIRWRLAQSAQPTFVIVDEGHIMFQREDTARFVSGLFRMSAKQDGRVALLTQGIVDIVGDPQTGMVVPGQSDARYCLENSGFKLLMRNDNDVDIAILERTLGITPAEGHAIKNARHGQGILLIGDPASGTQRAYVEVLIPDYLYPWVTSNPQEVRQFEEQGVFRSLADPPWTEGLDTVDTVAVPAP